MSMSHLLGLPKIESRSLGKRVAYVGCSTTRQSQIATAVTSANSYVSAATSYLNGISSGTTRYTTWFGTYSSSRASTVRSHFSAIGTDASSTTYDCSTCTSSAYAYVYANQPGRVYLCSAFWSAPNTGTDSRAGTIVHEQSHFTVNGGTQDIVYGQSGARSLASSSPDRAIQNADSHEYFAENNPWTPHANSASPEGTAVGSLMTGGINPWPSLFVRSLVRPRPSNTLIYIRRGRGSGGRQPSTWIMVTKGDCQGSLKGVSRSLSDIGVAQTV
ncbi:deuterolysin metalloprotease (M35) family domain-containing protein [Rhizoctonia solani AG-1 IA]|uniref:Deuterolysin metalloprotease (M35) family domain-containing protein n=1 Tax=Thanatephorus cucumeris (strain AG1-IA) TaxID=983506 RepID=L8X3Y2_THACA|nr:deuterolysin metalloprotease (M35) family domain-containing protein [Rhizoctonia solani AG-1 IA]